MLDTDTNPPCIPVVNQEKGDKDEEEELVYDPSLDKSNPGEVEDEGPMPKAADMKKTTCLEFTTKMKDNKVGCGMSDFSGD